MDTKAALKLMPLTTIVLGFLLFGCGGGGGGGNSSGTDVDLICDDYFSLTTYEVDRDNNGIPEETTTRELVYDNHGNILTDTTGVDIDGDGVADGQSQTTQLLSSRVIHRREIEHLSVT